MTGAVCDSLYDIARGFVALISFLALVRNMTTTPLSPPSVQRTSDALAEDDDVRSRGRGGNTKPHSAVAQLGGAQSRESAHVLYTISPEPKAADQRASGRCWAFAGLSMLRRRLMRNMVDDKEFELSQSHFMFYDKLEKAHAFHDAILTSARVAKKDARTTTAARHLLDDPIPDGGDWGMSSNIAVHGSQRGHARKPRVVQLVDHESYAGRTVAHAGGRRAHCGGAWQTIAVHRVVACAATARVLCICLGFAFLVSVDLQARWRG